MFNFGPKVPQVSVDDLKKVMDEKQSFVLLDVRTAPEVARARIAGSTHVPVDEISEKIEKVIPDKTQTVYVYCLSGSRSVIAVEIMQQLGYTKVFDVANGLLAWRAKYYSVES